MYVCLCIKSIKSLVIGVVGIKMQKLWNLFILPGEVVK